MTSRHNHRSLPEAILVWFLEVLGAITAILFGTFGVMSWKAVDEANSRSDTSNLVALVALCAQLDTGDNVSPNTRGDSAYTVRRATCDEDVLRVRNRISDPLRGYAVAYKQPRSQRYLPLRHPFLE